MSDGFRDYADSAGAPARHVVAITPSDVADLSDTPKGIYIGVGGDLAVIGLDAPADASPVVLKSLPSGSLLPLRARRVMASDTTATNLVGLV